MTQRQLAEAVGFSQGKLSKYENGFLSISDEDAESIAGKTGFRTTFLRCADVPIGLGSSLLFNRQRKTTPIAVQRQVQARVNVVKIQLERLLRAAEVDTSAQLARIDPDKHDGDPREVARRVRAALRLPMGPVPSVTHAIESAGGIAVLCDFGTDRIDGAHMWLPGLPPLFFMNRDVPGDRHRFNLSHELGHAVMHEFPTGDIETEANEFAAELLMPSSEIVRELRGLTIERAAHLKQRWRVSMSALIFNAHRLGCISDHRRRVLYATLRSMLKSAMEPIHIPLEEPVLVKELVKIHRRSLGFTDEDLRDLFMMDDPEFMQLDADTAPAPKPLRIDPGPLRFEDYNKRRAVGE